MSHPIVHPAPEPGPAPEPTPTPTVEAARPEDFAGDFHAVETELRGIAREQLAVLNVNPTAAVETVRRAMRRMTPLAAAIAALPNTDHAALALLPRYVGALWYTHALCLRSAPPPSEAPALARACADAFTRLQHWVQVLLDEGVLSTRLLEELGAPQSRRDTAMAVSAMVDLLREKQASLHGIAALAPEALDAFERTATELLTALAGQDATADSVTSALELRQRAYTRVAYAYDHARRAVAYLRWDEDDADTFAPSLHLGKTNTPHKDAPEPAATATATTAPSAPAAPAKPNATLAALSGDASKIPNFAMGVPKPFG